MLVKLFFTTYFKPQMRAHSHSRRTLCQSKTPFTLSLFTNVMGVVIGGGIEREYVKDSKNIKTNLIELDQER